MCPDLGGKVGPIAYVARSYTLQVLLLYTTDKSMHRTLPVAFFEHLCFL